jgi:hypothetical protein
MMEKFVLTCREIALLSSKEIDTKLPRLKRFQMALHITLCKTCSCYRRHLISIHHLVQNAAPSYDELILEKESSTLPEVSKERIKQFLKNNSTQNSEVSN